MAEFLAIAILFILGLGGYWSFFVFPRQRDFAKRQNMVRALAEGDEVITAGGIIGRVLRIEGEKGLAHVELAEGLEVRVIVASILDTYDSEELAKNAQRGQQEVTE